MLKRPISSGVIIILRNRLPASFSLIDRHGPLDVVRNGRVRISTDSTKELFGADRERGTSETREAILRNTEISRGHLTPEIALRLLTPNCPLYHSPAPLSRKKSDPATVAAFEEPFWSIYWPGGQALARFVLDQGEELFCGGHRALGVLDLGAGCGATAIAAKLRGAGNVLANDTDPAACVAIGMNAALNGVRVKTSPKNLIAGDDSDRRDGHPSVEFDVIFVGDLLYDEEIAAVLEPWLDRELLRGARIFIGDPGRHCLNGNIRNKLKLVRSYSLPENVRRENFGFDSANVWQFVRTRPPIVNTKG